MKALNEIGGVRATGEAIRRHTESLMRHYVSLDKARKACLDYVRAGEGRAVDSCHYKMYCNNKYRVHYSRERIKELNEHMLTLFK